MDTVSGQLNTMSERTLMRGKDPRLQLAAFIWAGNHIINYM